MARPASRYPTELELEILKVIWRDGPSPVRHVRDGLVGFRKLAYTSVMTIMNIMVQKGYLARKKVGLGYVYRPRVTERTNARKMLTDIVKRVFDGSASAVMVNLLETSDLDEVEIKKLRKLLKQKSGEATN